MMKQIVLGIVGVVLAIGVVAAQQPTPAAAADKPTDKTAAVIAALKGNSSAVAEPVPVPLTTVLDRYARMAAAGQQTPAAVTASPSGSAWRAISKPAPSSEPTEFTPVPVVPPPTSADTLDAIRADLRALLGRLDALVHPDGRQ